MAYSYDRRQAKRRKKLPKNVLISATVRFKHEGRLVTVTVERTKWLGGDKMLYYWRTADGKRVETVGVPDDVEVLDPGR